MNDRSDSREPPSEGGRAVVSVADQLTPGEPFACPECGQMLAPSVRVCVACKRPVDPARVAGLFAAASSAPARAATLPLERARFSWPIFLVVLLIWMLAAVLTQQVWGAEKSKLIMGSVVILSSGWVYFDAEQKGVPKPLRWGIGALLLWIFIFPWYLARRRTPKAPCPFIEGDPGPVARALFVFLVIFYVLSALLFVFLKGPHR